MKKKRSTINKMQCDPFGPFLRMTQTELMEYLHLAPSALLQPIRYRLVVDPVNMQIRTIHYPNNAKPSAI